MFAFKAGAIIGLAIIVHYADVVKYLHLCYIRAYRAVPVFVGFQWLAWARPCLGVLRCQIRGQGRICPTAAKAAVCHRPAPLAALVLLGLISPAQGQAPETPAACAANKGVCPTADNGGLSVIK